MHRPVLFEASSEKQAGLDNSEHEFQGALVSIYKNSQNPPTNPLHSIDIVLKSLLKMKHSFIKVNNYHTIFLNF